MVGWSREHPLRRFAPSPSLMLRFAQRRGTQPARRGGPCAAVAGLVQWPYRALIVYAITVFACSAKASEFSSIPAQDIAVLAATCVTCHAPVAVPGGIPSLQGRNADDLLMRLRAFKAAGPEKADAASTIMPLLLQGYDDAQITALARWFGRKEQR